MLSNFYTKVVEFGKEYLVNDFEVRGDGVLVDRRTLKTYRNDSLNAVRMKCSLIVFANLIKMVFMAAFEVLKVAYLVSCFAIHLIRNMAAVYRDNSKFAELKNSMSQRKDKIGQELTLLGYQVIMALVIELGAIYGVFHPYCGRKIIDELEASMNKGKEDSDSYMALCFKSRDVPS